MAAGWMGYVLNVTCFVVFVLMLAWYVLLLYGDGCLILGFSFSCDFCVGCLFGCYLFVLRGVWLGCSHLVWGCCGFALLLWVL